MNRPRIELAFDRRFAFIRAMLLTGVLAGDLLWVQRPAGPRDWGVAAAGAVLCLATARWVFGALLAESALLVVAHALGAGPVASVKVLAALTLFELAVREPGRRPAVGAGALAFAVLANRVADLPGELPQVLYKMGVVAGVPLLLGAYVRATRDAAAHAREHARQQELQADQRLMAARATERTAIARELHDLVAHHVSSMVLRVGVARHVITATGDTGDTGAAGATGVAGASGATGPVGATCADPAPGVDPRITGVLDDLHSSGSAALADLRRLVAVLRAPDGAGVDASSLVTPGALPAALHAVVERSRRTGLTVTASVDPAVALLDAVRGLAVLRLVQEGLANSAKHAGSGASAELTVRVTDRAVHVTLQDRGGHARSPAAGPAGHGLTGMRERMDLLGGRLDARPEGHGWLLAAELPLSAGALEAQS
ncbi:histidine kinase [Streptomyces sp. NPDC048518]|uniref:sensor histidine kinase n=1 Tax=Streptomyces sp. NPDC048518 TaxID=3155029 RepID=UPI0033C7727C